VVHGILNDFIADVKSSFISMFGMAGGNESTWVVNERHLARINEMLADARAKGATVTPCMEYIAERDGRQMPLHIVTNCTADMRIMQEELFGPILPVVPYDTMDDAIRFINAGDRPLALYCFSHDEAERQDLLRRTHSGGVTLNDWGWHVVNHDAPFGGIGNSGMGTYHGVEGFRELSHAKTVFKRHRFFPSQWFYPPYGKLIQRLTLGFFLGKADPSLKKEDE
jgi:coniferyl-aldehyde dehydrogenase